MDNIWICMVDAICWGMASRFVAQMIDFNIAGYTKISYELKQYL